ncbi:hypothetical protein DFP72DRAFT_1064151 [Ephemerocybe angulata]|uniref:DUF6589 domain-containing protein n=1 Tax=Ephemerocybe angulata TaxID=980116 RepID=A0A8H6I814_9AGAR|nr:hypothetical protein DFP72DRAFT_1064151 [Tulosesus angulatus]
MAKHKKSGKKGSAPTADTVPEGRAGGGRRTRNSVRVGTLEAEASGSGGPMEGVEEVNRSQPRAGPSRTTTAGQRGSKRRADRRTVPQKVSNILPMIAKADISPFDLIITLLDESLPQYKPYRTHLYERNENDKLSTIFTMISQSPSGKLKLGDWLRSPAGVKVIGNTIGREMDELQPAYTLKGLKDITPEYIQDREEDNFDEDAPFMMSLLRAAAQTERQAKENKKKSPDRLCNSMMRQLLYQRSNRCLGFPAEFGFFLWATGSSRAAIEAAHACGLSVRYQSVLNGLEMLAQHCMELAINAASGLHAFCYDNINLSTSIHVEQRGATSTPGKVTSGTFGIVYPLPNATPETMLLQPILDNMRNPDYAGLSFEKDLQPSPDQLASILHQFEDYDDPALRHKPRRLVPTGRTDFYPIRVSTTEEASVKGNLKYQQEVYFDMFGLDSKDLSKYAIPSINDQLTNSRIRSSQVLRVDDLDDFHRRLIFQLAMGLFHAALNLVWALLHVHRGTSSQIATVAYWIVVLEKVRLLSAKPDYHTAYAFLIQILEGVVLAAWKEICLLQDPTLSEEEKANATGPQKARAFERYAKSKPEASDLVKKAELLLSTYIVPLPQPYTTSAGTDDESSEDDTNSSESEEAYSGSEDGASTDEVPPPEPEPSNSTIPPPVATGIENDPKKDKVHQNLRLLIRDTLYLLELVSAVKDGDFGRVEDILPHLALIFRGAGSNNYCTEILHLVQCLKYLWPGDFADVMRDIMIVNPSGIPGHSLATDINMEYTIREIKTLIIEKGLESTWDHVGDISAAIEHLKEIKRKIAAVLNLPHQNKGHRDVDTRSLVIRVAEKVELEGLLKCKRYRKGNAKAVPMPDLLENGTKKVRATIVTFNQKFKDFVQGQEMSEEQDDIPPMGLALFAEEENPPNDDEKSDSDSDSDSI